jgi:hypothetical protein
MIFPDSSEILPYCVLTSLVIAAAWAFRNVRAKRLWIQTLVRTISVISLIPIALATLWFLWLDSGKATRYAPIYSPDHSRAIRISHYEDPYGDSGGPTSVDLYSSFGLYSKRIFEGPDMQTSEIKDVRWISDSEVLIKLQDVERVAGCSDAIGVKVRCEL